MTVMYKRTLSNNPRFAVVSIFEQGAERLNEGCCSEALTGLQAALVLPAPTALVAYMHLLSGSCLAHMVCSHTTTTTTTKAVHRTIFIW